MTSPGIEDVPCVSCQYGYRKPHTCEAPDYCPCDDRENHTAGKVWGPKVKHRLKYRGAPHTDDGHLKWRSLAGSGRARCSCGWLSKELPSGGARRRAHLYHKVFSSFADGAIVLGPNGGSS